MHAFSRSGRSRLPYWPHHALAASSIINLALKCPLGCSREGLPWIWLCGRLWASVGHSWLVGWTLEYRSASTWMCHLYKPQVMSLSWLDHPLFTLSFWRLATLQPARWELLSKCYFQLYYRIHASLFLRLTTSPQAAMRKHRQRGQPMVL